MKIVDTRGQLCPGPVIAARKALKETENGGSFTLLTDNNTSFNNLIRFFRDNKAEVTTESENGVWKLTVRKVSETNSAISPAEYCTPEPAHFEKGDFVVVISSDRMGEGDAELGELLMGNFIKALKDLEKLPERILFYNKGVTLVTVESPFIDHLRQLEKMGVEIQLCATCVAHYKLNDKLGAGILSNMYTIAEIMASAGKVIKP
jgi:selenium metabolism protein YedF